MNVAREIVAGLAALALFAVPSFAPADTQAPTAPSPAVVEAQGEVHGVKVTVRASSMLADPKQPNHYSPINLLDTDDSTVWAEGVPGNGEGQWVEVETPNNLAIVGFEMVPGHGKSAKLFAANARPRRLIVEYFCGLEGTRPCGRYILDVPKLERFGTWIVHRSAYTVAARVRVTFASVWPGAHAEDLCVARFRPILKNIPGKDDILGRAQELGPSLIDMLTNLGLSSDDYVSPEGLNITEYQRFSSDGTPVDKPKRTISNWMPGHAVPGGNWTCFARVYNVAFQQAPSESKGFAVVDSDSGTNGGWTAFVSPSLSDRASRPLRIHWRYTSAGWKMTSVDTIELSDDDQDNCAAE